MNRAKPLGPVPPSQWEASLRRLVQASKAAEPGPSWWGEDVCFFGTFETLSAGSQYSWDGRKRFKKGDQPFFFFQFTLAGWGTFEQHGEAPQRVTPGMGFIATVPSRHRYYLPKDSPGWTFGWLNVFHPYLIERVAAQIARTGPLLHFGPSSTFIATALQLIASNFKKGFRDRFEVELALFEFVIAFERLAHELRHPSDERERVLEAVRKWALGNPKRAVDVNTLAEEFGMSRSNFSHFFRTRTGLTPARVVTQTRVREATRMLLDTDASLKQIADACGFANANHFNRVFRRFQHTSPGAYRKFRP